MTIWRMLGGTAVFILFIGLLAACTMAAQPNTAQTDTLTTQPTDQPLAPTPVSVSLPDLGPAPEIENEEWLNTEAPATLVAAEGKVVLLEFWTFGCINCKRTIPWIQQWHEAYTGDDFTVISVHYPEFAYEEKIENVAEATEQLGVTYPVAIDNDGLTWRAYQQRYWPTTYLIDKQGRIRYKHIGEFSEGAAVEAEAAIEQLMAE